MTQRRAIFILFVRVIAIVATWVCAALWFKHAPPPTISQSERMFNQVATLLTAGFVSCVIAMLDRQNAKTVFRTLLFAGLGAVLGAGIDSWRFDRYAALAGTIGAIIGLVVSRRFSRPPR